MSGDFENSGEDSGGSGDALPDCCPRCTVPSPASTARRWRRRCGWRRGWHGTRTRRSTRPHGRRPAHPRPRAAHSGRRRPGPGSRSPSRTTTAHGPRTPRTPPRPPRPPSPARTAAGQRNDPARTSGGRTPRGGTAARPGADPGATTVETAVVRRAPRPTGHGRHRRRLRPQRRTAPGVHGGAGAVVRPRAGRRPLTRHAGVAGDDRRVRGGPGPARRLPHPPGRGPHLRHRPASAHSRSAPLDGRPPPGRGGLGLHGEGLAPPGGVASAEGLGGRDPHGGAQPLPAKLWRRGGLNLPTVRFTPRRRARRAAGSRTSHHPCWTCRRIRTKTPGCPSRSSRSPRTPWAAGPGR